MEEMRNAYSVLIGESGKPMHGLVENIKMDLKREMMGGVVYGEFWPEHPCGRDNLEDQAI
jgi:hypothetical protein